MTKNNLSFEFFLAENGFIRIPLITNKIGHLQVMVRIEAEYGIFIVDTGASITLLDKSFAKKAALPWTYPQQKVNIAGGRGQELLETKTVHMQIDQLILEMPHLYISDLSHINEALTNKGALSIAGVLGADVLLSRSAIIDYDTAALYLKPNPVN